MIKYIALFSILCFGYQTTIAQRIKPKGYHNLEVGERTYIVASKANVRDKPSVKDGAIIDFLSLGAKVEIIEKTTASYESNKIRANWYKISFKGREGYIWGGLIAAGWRSLDTYPDTLLLYGLNYCEMHYGAPGVPLYYTGNLSLKLCVDHKLVSQTDFDIEDIHGRHQLTFRSLDTILFSAKEFAYRGEEAVFKNEYLFAFQDEELQFVEKKEQVAPMPKQNGLVPLQYPEYLRFHKIKRYRGVSLWKTRKRTIIPSADYLERTIKIGKRKGYVLDNHKFDVRGNVMEDYHYLAEGPLVYKYEYRYINNPSYPNRIDLILDKTGSYQINVRQFIYKNAGAQLDSVQFYTIYDEDYSKKMDVSTITKEEYEREEPSSEKRIYLGEQLRIMQTNYYCYEYFYEDNLLKKEIHFYENCQKISSETIYEYDSKGLLMGAKTFSPKGDLVWEYVYLYDFYPSESEED